MLLGDISASTKPSILYAESSSTSKEFYVKHHIILYTLFSLIFVRWWNLLLSWETCWSTWTSESSFSLCSSSPWSHSCCRSHLWKLTRIISHTVDLLSCNVFFLVILSSWSSEICIFNCSFLEKKYWAWQNFSLVLEFLGALKICFTKLMHWNAWKTLSKFSLFYIVRLPLVIKHILIWESLVINQIFTLKLLL